MPLPNNNDPASLRTLPDKGDQPSLSAMAAARPQGAPQSQPQVEEKDSADQVADKILEKVGSNLGISSWDEVVDFLSSGQDRLTKQDRLSAPAQEQGPSLAGAQEFLGQGQDALTQHDAGGFRQMASQGQPQQPSQQQRVDPVASPFWQNQMNQAFDLIKNMPQVPTMEQFKSERGIKDPSFWQQVALGAAYGGPAQANQAYQQRLQQGYQDYASPMLQKRDQLQSQLDFLKTTMPDFEMMTDFPIGDQLYRLPSQQAGYLAGSMLRWEEAKRQRGEKQPLNYFFPEFASSLGPYRDVMIHPDDFPSWAKAIGDMASKRESTLQGWATGILYDIKEGKPVDKETWALAEEIIMSEISEGRMSLEELAVENPNLATSIYYKINEAKARGTAAGEGSKGEYPTVSEQGEFTQDAIIALGENEPHVVGNYLSRLEIPPSLRSKLPVVEMGEGLSQNFQNQKFLFSENSSDRQKALNYFRRSGMYHPILDANSKGMKVRGIDYKGTLLQERVRPSRPEKARLRPSNKWRSLYGGDSPLVLFLDFREAMNDRVRSGELTYPEASQALYVTFPDIVPAFEKWSRQYAMNKVSVVDRPVGPGEIAGGSFGLGVDPKTGFLQLEGRYGDDPQVEKTEFSAKKFVDMLQRITEANPVFPATSKLPELGLEAPGGRESIPRALSYWYKQSQDVLGGAEKVLAPHRQEIKGEQRRRRLESGGATVQTPTPKTGAEPPRTIDEGKTSSKAKESEEWLRKGIWGER